MPSSSSSSSNSPPTYDFVIAVRGNNHVQQSPSFVTTLEPLQTPNEKTSNQISNSVPGVVGGIDGVAVVGGHGRGNPGRVQGSGGGGSDEYRLLPSTEKEDPASSTVQTLVAKGKDFEAVADWARDAAGGDGEDGTRETWNKKIDFLLSIIGFAVDLANVWRFPYLCYKNGGGIGICQCLIAFYVAFYYNVIIAWSLYYLVSSLSYRLPWTSCNNTWNTERCVDGSLINSTMENSTTPAEEFFERGVLGLHESDGLSDIGSPRTYLVLCLFAVFVMIYFSLWKGVKSSGKVVWVTATMPYVVLSILLVRGLLLPGASTGIMYYITPRLDRLGDQQVWIDAAVQIFYSVGAGFGVHVAFASYNKINSNCYRDCLVTVCVNSFTSLFSGFVIFSYLGYMSVRQGREISKVAAEGPGLVFVVYPEAIATLPGSVGWSILFFVMLITLGLDSAMGGLEAVLTGLSDEWKATIKRFRFGREALTAVVVFAAFLLALPNVTNGGMYLVTMWDTFAAGTAILFGVFSQAVAVSWFYGLEQFCKDAQQILGFRPNIYWRLTWKFISPFFILVIVISSIVSFKPLVYESYTMGEYVYPVWANVVGWLIAASSMSFIPIVAVYQMLKFRGTIRQRFALAISPHWEHRSIMEGGRVKRFQRRHWLAL